MSTVTKKLYKKYCVFGCDEPYQQIHRFPHPNNKPDLYERWVAIIGDKLQDADPMTVYNNKRICNHHFRPEEMSCGRRLLPEAVPTLNLQGLFKSKYSTESDHNDAAILPQNVSSNQSCATNLYIETNLAVDTKEHQFNIGCYLSSTSGINLKQDVCMSKPNNSQNKVYGLRSVSGNETEPSFAEHQYTKKRHNDHNYCFLGQKPLFRPLGPTDELPPTSAGVFKNLDDLRIQQEPLHISALQSHLNEEKSDRDDNEVLIEGVFDLEPEVTKRLDGPFTWQQKPNVFKDETEKVSDDESSIDNIFPRKESPLTEPRNISTDDPEPLTEHTDYVCNECNIAIYGARYKCVQCTDYDVCVECEARGVHAAHYVLRVPRGSPQDQVRRVIDAIKRCLEENEPEIMIPEVEEIKDEIKEETPDVEECDPLYAFDNQQVPKPGDIAIHQEDRAQHARLKTNASNSITHQTATNVIRKTDSNILRQTDNNTLYKTDSNILRPYVNGSVIINHSDANLANPINTYLLLDTNDINTLQKIDNNVVSRQTDNNVTAQTNTYFLYENVLHQTDPTLINQTSTNVTDHTGNNLITQTGSNEIDLTRTKEEQFGANIIYKSDTYKLHSLKTTDALPHVSQVMSDSSDISNSSKPLNQKLVPVRKTQLHSPGNSRINPLIYKERFITPVKRDVRGNLLLKNYLKK